MNNNKTTPRNTRKHFFTFILVSSVAIVILLAIIFSVKKINSKDKQNEKETNSTTNDLPEPNPIPSTEQKNCPYLDETKFTTDPGKKTSKVILSKEFDQEKITLWRKIPQGYIIKLWKKGYHWHDILQLWGWKIAEEKIPDLKAEQRIGVVNSLAYMAMLPTHILEDETITKEEKIKMLKEDRFGQTQNLMVIVRKVSNDRGGVSIDERVSGASSAFHGGNTQRYTKKLITFTLNQENLNPTQYEISLLNCIGADNFENERDFWNSTGKSFGSAIYLALLSALHQKPINRNVAATGVINKSKPIKAKLNGSEVNLESGSNLPIAGLNGKSHAAVEKGISRLVLSFYNAPPILNILNKTDYYIGNGPDSKHITEEWGLAEDYFQVVSPKIREKLTVYWAKNISELRELVLGGKLS